MAIGLRQGAMAGVSAAREFRARSKALMGTARTIVEEANVAALNRVAVSTRAEAARVLRKRYPGFKAKEIKDAIKISKAHYKRPVARLRISGRRTPLIAFSAKQNRTGVSVRIKQRKTIAGAFIAKMPSGYVGVFMRSGDYGRRGNKKLERIAQLHSLSIPQAMEQDQVLKDLSSFSEQRYKIELAHEIKFRTARARGKLK